MYIAYVINVDLAVSPFNGIRIQAETWADELARQGHKVVKVNPWEKQDWAEYDLVQEQADQIAREHASVGSMEEMLNIAVQSILKNRRAALHIFNSGNRDIYERYLMQTCDYVVGLYLASVIGERKIAREDRDVLVRSYSCWCFGLAMDWMHHGLKEDIQPKLKRLCDLRQGMLEETLARCRVE